MICAVPDVRLRTMEEKDWSEVADLISVSMNHWDQTHGRPGSFSGGPAQTALFCQVYEALDPGCCVIAENVETGRITGSCFYRERETHVSLGIMNVHPNYFGKGVGKQLLQVITDFTDKASKPLRLVSSALNLDSFSLYTKAGFVPRLAYQDLLVEVPDRGFDVPVRGSARVRPAALDDVEAMAAVELEVSGISRARDYRYFIENADGFWHVAVYENGRGGIDGYLVASGHPLFNEIGPGVARTEEHGSALLVFILNELRGRMPLVLVPVECDALVRLLYSLGGRNCETHFGQVRGAYEPFRGVSFPTFLPETG
jgi:GNAT superfamily N-acetyltransferase